MIRKSVEDTRKEFEKSFAEGILYDRQTQDENHRKMLIDSLHIFGVSSVLDLGTGTGYLAFPIAKQHKDCFVTGLDIVKDALRRNEELAKKEKIENIEFVSYDGINIPFENNSFDAVVTRYCLHHIIGMQDMFHEIYRILKPGGQLLLADPTPNAQDGDRFVDKYMQLKKDEHVRFYTKDELVHMAGLAGLIYETSAMTKIRFPRIRTAEVDRLLQATNASIKDLYEIEVRQKEVFITEDVLNLSFFKG
ncbi:MAG: class I SAM-dependent methyltransferase [bacterium]|nr:class I SAM-dependent methyltransferase [bacterium]